jgi:hypothetical protein
LTTERVLDEEKMDILYMYMFASICTWWLWGKDTGHDGRRKKSN